MASKKFCHERRASIPRANRPATFFGLLSKGSAGLTIALGLLPAVASRAQEALRSALSADAAINSQTNTAAAPQPDNPRIGPVLLNLGAYTAVTFDNNINAAQYNPRSDTSIHTGVDLGFICPARDNSQIQLDSSFGYVTYLNHTRSDSIEIAPDSALTWTVTFDDGSLTFYDQFFYSDEVVTVPSVAGLNSLPRFENTVGGRAQWTPGNWDFEVGLSQDNFLATESSFDYLNRSSQYLYLQSGWNFSQKTQAGLQLSASQTDYQLSIQSDNTSFSLGPYINWQLTQYINLNASGGPTIYNFDAAGPAQPASTLNAYYFDFELSHQLTDSIWHHLSARQDVSLGYNQGNNYTELLSINYSVNWNATRYANLGLDLTYEVGNQPLTENFMSVTENFDRVGVGIRVNYQFTDRLVGSLSFSHWDRTSNLAGNSYDEASVSFQLNYHF